MILYTKKKKKFSKQYDNMQPPNFHERCNEKMIREKLNESNLKVIIEMDLES